MTPSLVETIESNFGLGSPPEKNALVRFDGFDELDKTHALELFLGKSAADIANELLQPQGSFGQLGDIEDLIVMEPLGYQYYLAPYVVQIIRNEHDAAPDLELTSLVLFAIREILRIRSNEAFSQTQQSALLQLVSYLADGSDRWDSSDAFAESLPEHLQWLQTKLSAVLPKK